MDGDTYVGNGLYSTQAMELTEYSVFSTEEDLSSLSAGQYTVVAVDENGKMKTQQMEYSQLTPLLTAALQEAIAEIEILKAEVAALKSS